jgi:hypothetical protein
MFLASNDHPGIAVISTNLHKQLSPLYKLGRSLVLARKED